eukprot:CAMPEP_0198296220 /NCGR_PEP_ID=MMETSP1449-20131203/31530_1 /TAXON_ID=420275 /ORGANISM="Attheya septentrionalis, Strain CCMP2084" /LENGTH=410 /DNA_ID=CAMNT_0043996773 /DNA_START=112 /DNA_END=1344 /DNA_ORIENTATION=-
MNCKKADGTAAPAAAELEALYPTPSLTRVLTKRVVASRVAERVLERNSWNGYERPGAKATANMLLKAFPTFLGSGLPSQKELDKSFPVQPLNFEKLRNPPLDKVQITWLGHATMLVQMGGANILTDPMFSDRCSAVQWAGPKRYRPPACSLEDLRKENIEIHSVLVSHNHYDHLDYRSIAELASQSKNIIFVVPIGLRAWFVKHTPNSIKSSNPKYGHTVVELDWHETLSISPNPKKTDLMIDITAVPMQHWSNRAGDIDKTLWCGFSVVSKQLQSNSAPDASSPTVSSETTTMSKFLFAGDTGWFEEVHDLVGRRYGPFDVAALPIGAYKPRNFMKCMHMNPEDAVDMMKAVDARMAVPIHWATFPLTVEPIFEPRERLITAMKQLPKSSQALHSFDPWLLGETVVSKK